MMMMMMMMTAYKIGDRPVLNPPDRKSCVLRQVC